MKKLLIIAFWLIGFYANAQNYEKGVSKELAASRTQNISNVSYDLTFDIPANASEKIKGTVDIEFLMNRRSDVVLDFQGEFAGTCLVNGRQREVQVKNDHIIIPQKRVKAGVNHIKIDFVSLDKALNRHADYLYAQFTTNAAQSCFPCFDQPDMRATFTTRLNVPNGWKSLINKSEGPISTTFYSFTAGKFEEQTGQHSGYSIRVFHQNLSPEQLKQLPAIINETAQALKWMEGYTGIKHPYQELGMVILPGSQPGGMEHLGFIQQSNPHLFLGSNPTQEEHSKRMQLIAHEAAAQWFGNMVTFKWPENAWAKELLVNFMASKIIRQQGNKADNQLNFLRTYHSRAIAFDRTEGTHPIIMKQEKTDEVKLFDDDITYAKGLVMMNVLEDLVGAKELQEGLQKFLVDYYLKEVSWDDLISALDRQAPAAGLRQFSEVWTKEKGMPTIHTTYQNGQLVVSQTDPNGRGLVWRQKFEVRLIYDLDNSRTVTVDMTQPTVSIKIGQRPSSIIPNYDGRGYGRFTLDNEYIQKLPLRLIVTRSDQHRYALLQTLHDNYLMGNIPASYFGELYRNMIKERNPLIMQTTVDHMFKIAFDRDYSSRQTLEQCIMDVLPENKNADCRKTIIRKMSTNATSPEILAQIQKIWDAQSDPLFDEHDYMEMAYRLALTYPGQWQMIIDKQRERLKNAQLREEFDYVSRACTPDEQAQRDLFNSLIKPENRTHEAWALHALRLLNADIREPQSNAYIPATLNALETIQETSDAEFVSNWLEALLQNHKSQEARLDVEKFLSEHPNYQQNLRHKVLAASWMLRNSKTVEPARPARPAKPARTTKSTKKK